MKKALVGFLVAALAVGSASAVAAAPAAFHIGVCTSTVSQAEDDFRAAEMLIKKYGDVASGGMVKHVTYPDNFMTEQETTISQITAFADDPQMKAVVVKTAVPGTTEAFRRIREKRPDILLFAGENHEDPGVITPVADLVVHSDSIARGYLNILAAHKLGCTDFVHISFPRHMSYELMSRRARIMEQTCKDLGMNYHYESAPDPTSDVGIAGAQQFILEHVPQWIDRYGEKTAFFCTNDAETEPLLRRIAEEGKGYFIEADVPSPLLGYPGALGVDLADVAGDFPAILKKVEDAVIAKGGAGRMGTWAYSYAFSTCQTLTEYAKACVENGVTPMNFRRRFRKDDLLATYNTLTPGTKWNGTPYKDANTGLEYKNYILVYQDTYIFGKGYLHMTDETVPEKYLTMK